MNLRAARKYWMDMFFILRFKSCTVSNTVAQEMKYQWVFFIVDLALKCINKLVIGLTDGCE